MNLLILRILFSFLLVFCLLNQSMGNNLASFAVSKPTITKPVQVLIADFLQSENFIVVGASNRRNKFGNKLVRCYQQNKREVIPVNPIAKDIEGLAVWKSLLEVPGIKKQDFALSIVTPAEVTETTIHQAAGLGITKIWLQPGAESPSVLKTAKSLGLQIIYGGPCVLVELGYDDSWTNTALPEA